ncbi:MAG: hypothetical protein FWH55_13040 [Oscillospiraceae bacterium]|nr:hypothetical protein [Oscillospiraceae bacterium]
MNKHEFTRKVSFLFTMVMVVGLLIAALPNVAGAVAADGGFVEMLHRELDDPGLGYAIEARWWLAEGSHTDQTLKDGVKALHDAGYGAFEFVTLNETGIDKQRYSWGSEEWSHDSALLIEEATKYGMGVSFTSGTNWGTANLPNITPDDEEAAQDIDYTSEVVVAGASRTGLLQKATVAANRNVNKQTLVSVIAYRLDKDSDPIVNEAPDLSHIPSDVQSRINSGNMTAPPNITVKNLDYDSCIILTDMAVQDGEDWNLNWTAPNDGDYELMVFWMRGNGHTSSPSVTPSNSNVTIDYFSGKGIDALIEYWTANILTDDLIKVIKENGRVQLYMDSLELGINGKGYWCSTFLDEFRTRRGYDLTPYMPFIMRGSNNSINHYYYEAAGDEIQRELKKIRLDLYQTLTELYSENTLQKTQEWLHSIGMTLRCEPSYCQTFDMTYPQQFIDSVETESYEFMDLIESHRSMSGGTHVYNKVLSSESGAQYMRYSTSFDRLLNMMYTQFAAGISRTVVHGFSVTAGPQSNYAWPGHQSTYALFTERVPYWRDSLDINTHVARLQKIMRDGAARMDVGILRYEYQMFQFQNQAFWDSMMRHYAFYWSDMTLQDAGYTYDYFSPEVLQHNQYAFLNDDGTFGYAGYQALVLFQEWLPLKSAQALLQMAKNGLPVVIVDGKSVEYQWGRNWNTHRGGGLQTPSNDGLDGELANVMAEMKQLANVKVVASQAGAYDALIDLGVRPRAEFAETNEKLLTVTRDWDGARFLYVYNYKFDEADSYTGDIIVDGTYAPYIYDPWTGNVTGAGEYTIDKDGNTVLTVSLKPGGIIVFALNPNVDEKLYAVSSDADSLYYTGSKLMLRASESGDYTTLLSNGASIDASVIAPASIPLVSWDLTVESWTRGDTIEITEDRGLGYISTEYLQKTDKTMIDVGTTPLISWSNIPLLGNTVSGVGSYTTKFTLPNDWNASNVAVFTVDSLGGNTARVYVNGRKADAVNIHTLKLDITDLVKPGENTIEVEVSTGITNLRLGYNQSSTGAVSLFAGPYDYGMIGDATIITYTDTAIYDNAAVRASIRADAASVGINAPASYTVSLENAGGVGVVTLSVTADGRYLDLYEATALNGFSIVDPLAWEYVGSQMWKGTVKLYYPGFVQDNDPFDVLRISGVARDLLGDTTVKLTGFTVTGDVNGYSGAMPSAIKTADAVISIVTKTVFSKYDLNHDGRIDELDLAIVVYYYLANDLEADWDMVKFDIASAKDCDVALNGRVDLADMIEVIANYCDSY